MLNRILSINLCVFLDNRWHASYISANGRFQNVSLDTRHESHWPDIIQVLDNVPDPADPFLHNSLQFWFTLNVEIFPNLMHGPAVCSHAYNPLIRSLPGPRPARGSSSVNSAHFKRLLANSNNKDSKKKRSMF